MKRLLICVKNPASDLRMLAYADLISRGETGGRQYHLLHVQDQPAEADPGADDTPQLSLDELQASLPASIAAERAEVICSVVTGAAVIEILRYAMEQDIDCLLVGCGSHGRGGTGRAVLARRLARKATCSVLTIPEGAPARITRLLVPIRDTECSARATQVACAVASSAKARVSCLNVFQVGSGFSKSGLSLEDQIDRLRSVAEHEARRMLVRVDLDGVSPEVRVVPDPYARPVEIILEECEKTSADLIVIGSRGRTGAAGVLLGKVTEELIAGCTLPVLAVKRKGEQIGILQALLSFM